MPTAYSVGTKSDAYSGFVTSDDLFSDSPDLALGANTLLQVLGQNARTLGNGGANAVVECSELLQSRIRFERDRLARMAEYDSSVLTVRLAEASTHLHRLERDRAIGQERERWTRYTNVAGVVVFVVVHLLVALAATASILEFRRAYVLRQRVPVTVLQINGEGVAIRTALQGVVMLVIGIVFYFMFVKYVYPVVVLPR